MLTMQQVQEAMQMFMDHARANAGRAEIRDPARGNALIGEFRVFTPTATRPQDMPRAMRPKDKLSKRQRDAAKREKLAAGR